LSHDRTRSRPAARPTSARRPRGGHAVRFAIAIASAALVLAAFVFLRSEPSGRDAPPGGVVRAPDSPEKSFDGAVPIGGDAGPTPGEDGVAGGGRADAPMPSPNERVLIGIVVDASRGEPLDSVQLLVANAEHAGDAGDADPSRVRAGRTDESGSFRIERVPSGALVLEARRRGFETTTVELPGDRGEAWRELVVEMSRVARIHGVVTGPDARPLSGAVVRLVPPDRRLADLSLGEVARGEVRTTPVGRYDLEGVRGDHRLAVLHASYAPWLSEPFSLEAAEVREIDVRLEAGTKIYGVVANRAGERMANAAIFAADLDRDGKSARARANPSGEYEMDGLLPGRFEASVLAADWVESGGMPVTVGFEVPPGFGPHRIDLIVDESDGVVLEGRIVEWDGTPVAAAMVQCVVVSPRPSGDDSRDDAMGSSGAVTTDVEGRFACGPLRPGIASVFVHAPRADAPGPRRSPDGARSASFEVDLPGPGRRSVDLVWPASVVTGSVGGSASDRARAGIVAVRLVPPLTEHRLPSVRWRFEFAPSEHEFRFDSVPG